MVRIIQHIDFGFSDGLLSLGHTHFRALHIFSWLNRSFLFIAEYYSIVWMFQVVYPVTY